MKISPISNFNYSQKFNRNNNITNTINNPYNLSFKSSYDDVYYVDVPLKSFDPLNADENELKNLGEVFHKYSDVETLCKRRYGTGLFTKYENTRAYEAYQKLSKSINETRKHKNELVAEMNNLLNKEIKGIENIISIK